MTRPAPSRLAVGLSVLGIPVLAQVWFWWSLFREPGYLAQSDLYEEFLPQFLAPLMHWSSFEFAGMPVFADPQNAAWYPVQLLARAAGSWSLYITLAYVIAGAGAAAYAWQITRSRVAAVLAGLAWPWSEAMADLTPHFAMLHGFAWLPWVLFGVERIADTRRWRWAGLTAIAVACFSLAGHPQVTVYGGYLVAAYVICLWVATPERRPELTRMVGAAAVAGGLLAAVQLVPTLALSDWIARNQVGFGHFADGFTKQPRELLAGIVPQFCHERRETPQYAGLLPVLLAFVAVGTRGREWRTRFWLAVAVIGLLLGLGSQTPLARVAYYLPLYDRFRVVARHLALAVLAIVMLGALGAAAIREGRLTGRRVLTLLAPLGGILAALAVVRSRPDLFHLPCDTYGLDWLWGGHPAHVWTQGLLAVASAGILLLASRPRGWSRLACLLPLLLSVDLLGAQTEPVDAHGLHQSPLVSDEDITPSVHAARIRAELAPTRQRVLPLEGSATDAVVPGMYARLWQLPSVGGYNPLLPARLKDLAQMNNNGSVSPHALLAEDVSMDLLAAKYVLVRASELPSPPPAVDADHTGHLPPIDALIGPSDCRDRGPMTRTLGTAPVDAEGLELTAVVHCGDHVRAGDRIGTITVSGADGTREIPLTFGPAPDEGHLVVPAERARTLSASFAPLRAARVTITATAPGATLEVNQVGLRMTGGGIRPFTVPAAAVATDRWREVRRFRTSRETDRRLDQDGRDEVEYVLLENTRALPRVWFAGEVFQLPDEHAPESVWFGRTRDGAALRLETRAFVRTGTAVEAGGGHATMTNLSIGNGRIAFDVAATSAGLAVVSELHHPSWRATVDGAAAGVVRADYAIMGVPVREGSHHVVLTFRPTSLWLGAGLSGIGALVVLACVFAPQRRRTETDQVR